jgi:hypothetical protein
MSISHLPIRRHSRSATTMMANAGNNSEGGTQGGRSLLDKIKSWDEAMQWSERYVKAEGDGVSEPWSPLYEIADFD